MRYSGLRCQSGNYKDVGSNHAAVKSCQLVVLSQVKYIRASHHIYHPGDDLCNLTRIMLAYIVYISVTRHSLALYTPEWR